jgi:hypothetical protein
MSVLTVMAYQGELGNPKSKPVHLINPDDKGRELEERAVVLVYFAGKCIEINSDGVIVISNKE